MTEVQENQTFEVLPQLIPCEIDIINLIEVGINNCFTGVGKSSFNHGDFLSDGMIEILLDAISNPNMTIFGSFATYLNQRLSKGSLEFCKDVGDIDIGFMGTKEEFIELLNSVPDCENVYVSDKQYMGTGEDEGILNDYNEVFEGQLEFVRIYTFSVLTFVRMEIPIQFVYLGDFNKNLPNSEISNQSVCLGDYNENFSYMMTRYVSTAPFSHLRIFIHRHSVYGVTKQSKNELHTGKIKKYKLCYSFNERIIRAIRRGFKFRLFTETDIDCKKLWETIIGKTKKKEIQKYSFVNVIVRNLTPKHISSIYDRICNQIDHFGEELDINSEIDISNTNYLYSMKITSTYVRGDFVFPSKYHFYPSFRVFYELENGSEISYLLPHSIDSNKLINYTRLEGQKVLIEIRDGKLKIISILPKKTRYYTTDIELFNLLNREDGVGINDDLEIVD